MRTAVSPYSILSSDSVTYRLIDETNIWKEIQKMLENVKETLGLKSNVAVRILLGRFNWDQNILSDRYWENPDRLLRLAKLPRSLSAASSSEDQRAASDKVNNRKVVRCQICCCDIVLANSFALNCGHRYCSNCWRRYLEMSILNENGNQMILCPSQCDQVLDDDDVLKLLGTNTNILVIYQKKIVNNFVETNRLTKWCPRDNCRQIIWLQSSLADDARLIKCDVCHIEFCFRCHKLWHDPIQCSLLNKWELKHQEESLNHKWLLANTQECPKCQSSIEKNGGCNHMTCRKLGCAHEFCWLCLAPWSGHQTRQCNVYRGQTLEKNKSKVRENLDRYVHYLTRYRQHNRSLEFENKLISLAEKKEEALNAAKICSHTIRLALKKAVEVLHQCRRTLKYSYAFAYYLYRSNQAEVFEQNQADLERATEALSGFLENEIDSEENISATLMSKTHYCDHRYRILLDHCKEGYMQHYWAGLDEY